MMNTRFLLIFTILLLACHIAVAKAEGWIAAPPREVTFPPKRSLGTLFVRRWGALDPTDISWDERFNFAHWKKLGEARGRVRVPAEQELALVISEAGRQDRSALAALRPNDLQSLHLSARVTDADLAHIQHLTGLRQLIIGNSPDLGDAGLAHLQDLASLELLVIWGCRQVDTGLGHLKGLTALSELALGGMGLSNRAMDDLSQFPSLKRLHLLYDDAGDAGIASLGSLRSLDYLGLVGIDVTEAGIAGLKDLSLKGLSLEGCQKVDDKALAHLTEMKTLLQLEIPGTAVTDAGITSMLDSLDKDKIEILWIGGTKATNRILEQIAGMPELRELDLAALPITDNALRTLQSLPRLRLLHLMGTKITDQGVPFLAKLKSLRKLDGT
ncbi:MAG: hypothetical protein M3347_11215, partial [Armatimonadota bacterium]|nr:hypothetical protein [Armatimonadota bacterium]